MAEVAFPRGERPALIGECQAPDIVEDVHEITPVAVNLCGHASLVEIVFLVWAATSAIGTDNGLMHLIAAAGCHSIVLYDPGSDAALSGHRGPDVTILRRHHLASITAAGVVQAPKKTRQILDLLGYVLRLPALLLPRE
jgi:ADP-heptose:LPS heptosyltransferase|tara:strand:+ start:837 stop:1253 length:417 start_codon:yes stop_codon:yes gene_type:complete